MKQQKTYESNELIDRLPPHLKQFIKPQNYEEYSPINQAVWRYVMRKNVEYLSKYAHESYLKGLEKTGIEIDTIPSMYGMNRILKEIGWAAVSVDGFIPPNAFMEFQAYKVLVIASDIRQLENIEYTPAPDIIHEAAGHAPIIANPDYAEYLRRLGEVGAKAILSKYDIDLYEAVRKLSILKEAELVDENELKSAEEEVNRLQQMNVELSEMAQIRNLQWWTVEYGLIGELEDPKIYGAGLLSSIGESKWCMSDQVKKIPYSIDAIEQSFDITQPQPQLYVSPDFSYLMQVLEEFANKLSLRKGGSKGVQRLIESQMVGTIELSTGLQVSGKFSRVILNEDREVIFFKTEGPTALAYRERELIGHGIETHSHGFSSPLGKLKNINLAIEDMGPVDLKAYNFYDGKWLSFEFESGIKVKGLNVTGIRNLQGKLMLIQLKDCTVTYKKEILFKPEYGMFDMVVGKEIVSAFAGAADYNSFPNLYNVSKTLTVKPKKSEKTKQLESYYQTVRDIRETGDLKEVQLQEIFKKTQSDYQNEWLLPLEMLELTKDHNLQNEITNYLEKIADENSNLSSLILEGINRV
ncbi:aromatic amino acid hydroxylase [Pseudotenacibaculum sp. MALMAid0570]|uniref:aromatic amino acid hydroxylase n=1 Tax=Pseudotenacibaculum sp. MALMAid0570 TaxID=3143938 RepID=UPI0032E02ADE